MVDLKLVALQTGTFGRAFAVWMAPLSFVVALEMSVAWGRCSDERTGRGWLVSRQVVAQAV